MYDCLAFSSFDSHTQLHVCFTSNALILSLYVFCVCGAGWLVCWLDSGCLCSFDSVLFRHMIFLCSFSFHPFCLFGCRLSVKCNSHISNDWSAFKCQLDDDMWVNFMKWLLEPKNALTYVIIMLHWVGCRSYTKNECAQMSRDIRKKLNERQIESVVESVGFLNKVDKIGTKSLI